MKNVTFLTLTLTYFLLFNFNYASAGSKTFYKRKEKLMTTFHPLNPSINTFYTSKWAYNFRMDSFSPYGNDRLLMQHYCFELVRNGVETVILNFEGSDFDKTNSNTHITSCFIKRGQKKYPITEKNIALIASKYPYYSSTKYIDEINYNGNGCDSKYAIGDGMKSIYDFSCKPLKTRPFHYIRSIWIAPDRSTGYPVPPMPECISLETLKNSANSFCLSFSYIYEKIP